jgi:hypothetical protein
MYVFGTFFYAVSEGMKLETSKRIELEQDRHQEVFRARQGNSIEVAQACEALNTVEALEARRKSLDNEIRAVDRGLRESLNETFDGTPPPPELSDEKRKRLNVHEQEARFASQKLNAYDALRAKLNRFNSTPPQGDAE